MSPTPDAFDLTEDHLLLARSLEWVPGENDSPAIDFKRPYGNGDIAQDIARILGWAWPDEEASTDYDTEAGMMSARCWVIHREMVTAMQIIAGQAGFATRMGRYVDHAEPYRRAKWLWMGRS